MYWLNIVKLVYCLRLLYGGYRELGIYSCYDFECSLGKF